MSRNELYESAMEHLGRGETKDALRIADKMINSESERNRLSGYICRGLAYEQGGDIEPDFDKAVFNYRKALCEFEDSVVYSYLARVMMKKKDFEQARRFLGEAEKIRPTAEVILGFANYYARKPVPDYLRARRFYVKAALHGRFAGFFGYSRMARLSGQEFRAFCMDCLRILVGPIVAILIGSKAQMTFWD